MSRLGRAARHWLINKTALPDSSSVNVVDVGIAGGRKTGVAHYVADAAEITYGDETTLAASWLCGGSTVDAEVMHDGEEPDCVSCRVHAAVPQRPVVYFAWGADDELLYIGSSIQVAVRIQAHMRDTYWWGDVRRLTFTEYASELEVRRAEAAEIRKRPGKYNRDGRRSTIVRPILNGIELGVEQS